MYYPEARRKTDTDRRLAANESCQDALLKLADETSRKQLLEKSKKRIEVSGYILFVCDYNVGAY